MLWDVLQYLMLLCFGCEYKILYWGFLIIILWVVKQWRTLVYLVMKNKNDTGADKIDPCSTA